MHWIKATAPNGSASYINLAEVANILPGNDGGSIVFMSAIATTPNDKIRYLTTATIESPEELLAMAPVALGVAGEARQPSARDEAIAAAAKVMKSPGASRRDKVAAASVLTQTNGKTPPKARAPR